MNKKTDKNRFIDILKTKFNDTLISCYRIDKQPDKMTHGLKHHFQKNKD